jgi:hypothetical protein
MEQELMAQGYSQEEAHTISSKTYNYAKEVDEYNVKTGKYKEKRKYS